MDFFQGVWSNKVLAVSLTAWLIAQALKVVTTFLAHGRVDLRRFVESGGMPSSHTALVTSLSVIVGYEVGFDSALFGVTVAFALIVMYDAAGVRRAAGKQAEILNQLIRELYVEHEFKHERLRELIGHTPVEVLAGAIVGVGVAVFFATR
ncbi:MAG: divergent PAP2 family protein [Bacillota bacterium]